MRGPIERRDAARARREAGRRDVADLAPRVLAVVAAVLAVVYLVAGVSSALLGAGPPLAGAGALAVVGLGLVVTARAAWLRLPWPAVVGTLVGAAGAVLFGILVGGFEPDPDGNQVEQDLGSFLGLGLFVLSLALFIAGVVWLVAGRRARHVDAGD